MIAVEEIRLKVDDAVKDGGDEVSVKKGDIKGGKLRVLGKMRKSGRKGKGKEKRGGGGSGKF